MPSCSSALVPPLLENRTLRKLLLKNLVRLLQRLAEIRNTDIQNSIRGEQRKNLAFIARRRRGDFVEFFTELREFREQRQLMIQILAPCDFLAHRNQPDGLRRRDLIA